MNTKFLDDLFYITIIVIVGILMFNFGKKQATKVFEFNEINESEQEISTSIIKAPICNYKNNSKQYELNETSAKCYDKYHKYYLKVANKIQKYDFGDKYTNNAIKSYINNYSKRKEEMENTLFPCSNINDEECRYGTIYSLLYSSSMMNFDKHELETYYMILTNMYDSMSIEDKDINKLFE